jgi:hypothetical protein
MISKEEISNLVASLKTYEGGIRRAGLSLVADDYNWSITVIEELQALCDEKDATIDELRSQLEQTVIGGIPTSEDVRRVIDPSVIAALIDLTRAWRVL